MAHASLRSWLNGLFSRRNGRAPSRRGGASSSRGVRPAVETLENRTVPSVARLSVGYLGDQANGASQRVAVSGDGRFVAFESDASNLVAGDTNGVRDIFVRDRLTGQTTRVSVDSAGNQANGASYHPSISADGRYVAFDSIATNLAPRDYGGHWNVYVRDLWTKTTTRVSMNYNRVDELGPQEANGDSNTPTISADGSSVVFQSAASNLVYGDTNGRTDIFEFHLATQSTTLVSLGLGGVQSDGDSYDASVSADGRYVAYQSYADNLVLRDTNGVADIFERDMTGSGATRVSLSTNLLWGVLGSQANDASYEPSISADGRYVAFHSAANNLTVYDTNGASDVFVRDTHNLSTGIVSVDSAGNQGNAASSNAAISADGQSVAFASAASNLAAGDTNGTWDVFVRNFVTGTTTRVSVAPNGGQADGNSAHPKFSGDGRYVAFYGGSDNLSSGDTNGTDDVFLKTPDPVANTDRVTLNEDAPATTIRLLANDTYDQYSGPLSLNAVFAPAHGTVALTADGAGVTYRPAANFNGVDTFSYIIQDGSGATAYGTVVVTVQAVNDAPVLSVGGGGVVFRRGGQPVVLGNAASVADVDSPDFAGGKLTVSLAHGGTSLDRLGIRRQGLGAGKIYVVGNEVLYGGVIIGTFSGGAGVKPLTVTFNAHATQAAVQALVRNLTFATTSASRTPRRVQFMLTDGDGGTSAAVSKTVSVA